MLSIVSHQSWGPLWSAACQSDSAIWRDVVARGERRRGGDDGELVERPATTGNAAAARSDTSIGVCVGSPRNPMAASARERAVPQVEQRMDRVGDRAVPSPAPAPDRFGERDEHGHEQRAGDDVAATGIQRRRCARGRAGSVVGGGGGVVVVVLAGRRRLTGDRCRGRGQRRRRGASVGARRSRAAARCRCTPRRRACRGPVSARTAPSRSRRTTPLARRGRCVRALDTRRRRTGPA